MDQTHKEARGEGIKGWEEEGLQQGKLSLLLSWRKGGENSIESSHLREVFSYLFLNFYLFINLFLFCLFRAIPMAYGSSQARGWIGTAAAGLHHSHSNARSKPQLRATPDP